MFYLILIGKEQEKLEDNIEDCDLVIEAATESRKIKLEIFRKIDKLCKKEAILASNTSSISIGEIGAQTQREDKVVGMHFMNPVPIMKLVEVIKSKKTNQKTIDIIISLSKELNKIPVLVGSRYFFKG